MSLTSPLSAPSRRFHVRITSARIRSLIPILLASSFLTVATSRTHASAARVSYETSGTIGSLGVNGSPVVQFVPSTGATDTNTPFSLGSFAVQPPTDGSVTRYSQTPVTISYWPEAINGTSTAGGDGTAVTPMVIHGWLSGTVGGSSPSSLSILFDQGLQPADPKFYEPRPLPPFPTGSSVSGGSNATPPGYLSLNNGQSLLTLTANGGGLTSVAASLDLAPNVPEPASLVVFLALGAGLLVARRCRGIHVRSMD